MFRFLHAADIHLDSPFVGLERYEGAPVDRMRLATRTALANLVQLALDEEVAFVVIAGDLYDSDWRDYGTGLYFVRQMNRLREAKIPVFAIAGNHDAANKMTKTLRLQAGVMMKTDEPETRLLKDIDVAIHGQGFASEAVRDDLSARYPAPIPGCFNIGLLHTCLTGRPGHANYAPCTIDSLVSKQYDYWALGHVHHAEVLSEEPYIVFPGNVQGRNIGETGPKGCRLVTVHDNREVDTEFRCLDVLRWERCAVDAARAESPDAVLSAVASSLGKLRLACDGRPLAVRVEIGGACPAHDALQANGLKWTNEIRSLANEHGADELWIEKVKIETSPHAARSSPPADGPLGELFDVIGEFGEDPSRLPHFRAALAELGRKLPPEFKDHLADSSWLRGMLPAIQSFLVSRLLSRETSR